LKLLTFHGRGRLIVPGLTLEQGESGPISEKLAEQLSGQKLDITITGAPKARGKSRKNTRPKRRASVGAESQPEAQQGEGQPTASTDQEE
jgi:hypothetical protein